MEDGIKEWPFVIFFFFKQKTAYEMCGRDWSSDVCSSDLAAVLAMSVWLGLGEPAWAQSSVEVVQDRLVNTRDRKSVV